MKVLGRVFTRDGYEILTQLVVDSIEERNNIPRSLRFFGLTVFVRSTSTGSPAIFYLGQGLTNADWQDTMPMRAVDSDMISGMTLAQLQESFVSKTEAGIAGGYVPLNNAGLIDMRYFPEEFDYTASSVSKPYSVESGKVTGNGEPEYLITINNQGVLVSADSEGLPIDTTTVNPVVRLRHTDGLLEIVSNQIVSPIEGCTPGSIVRFIKVKDENEIIPLVYQKTSIIPKLTASDICEFVLKADTGYYSDEWKVLSQDTTQVYTFKSNINLANGTPYVQIRFDGYFVEVLNQLVAYEIYFTDRSDRMVSWEVRGSDEDDFHEYTVLDKRYGQMITNVNRRYQLNLDDEVTYKYIRIVPIENAAGTTAAPTVGPIGFFNKQEMIYEQKVEPVPSKYEITYSGLVPRMTSNTEPLGYVVRVSGYNEGHQGYMAFDQNPTSYWQSDMCDLDNNYNPFIEVQIPSPRDIQNIKMTIPQDSSQISKIVLSGVTVDDLSQMEYTYIGESVVGAGETEIGIDVTTTLSFIVYRVDFIMAETATRASVVQLNFNSAENKASLKGDYWCNTGTVPLETSKFNGDAWESVQFVRLGEAKSVESPSIVPALSVDNQGTITASTQALGYEAWKAFDRVSAVGDCWRSADAPSEMTPQFIQLEFDFPTKLITYSIETTMDSSGSTPVNSPKTWVLYGTNSYTTYQNLDSDWTIVDSRVDQFTSATPGQKTTFIIHNPGSYKYYRLSITERNDADDEPYVSIGGLFFSDLQGDISECTPYAFSGRYETNWLPISVGQEIEVKDKIGSLLKVPTLFYSPIQLDELSSQDSQNIFEVPSLITFNNVSTGSKKQIISETKTKIGGATSGGSLSGWDSTATSGYYKLLVLRGF